MNRAEYKADIRSRVGKPSEDYTLRAKELELRIKQARIFIAERLWMFCKERLKTSKTYALSGSAKIEYQNLPAGFIKDLSVTINGYKADKINYEDYTAIDDNYYYAPTTASPVYFIKANTVGLSPTEAATNTVLYYISKPTEFSDDTTDESGLTLYIPAEFQDLVPMRVCEVLTARPDINYQPSLTVENRINTLLGKKKAEPAKEEVQR